MNEIYGIDTTKEINAKDVRDAIVNCFSEAHCNDTGIEEDMSKQYCKSVVEKAFEDTNGDFENPSKDDIQKVLDQLASFSKNFRNQEIIQKHYDQMIELAEMITD